MTQDTFSYCIVALLPRNCNYFVNFFLSQFTQFFALFLCRKIQGQQWKTTAARIIWLVVIC